MEDEQFLCHLYFTAPHHTRIADHAARVHIAPVRHSQNESVAIGGAWPKKRGIAHFAPEWLAAAHPISA
jgi:hypothetical protein